LADRSFDFIGWSIEPGDLNKRFSGSTGANDAKASDNWVDTSDWLP